MGTPNKNAKSFMKQLLGEAPSFAMLLRSIRTRDDLSQLKLSKILGVSVSHVSDIENGRKFVSVERAADFASRLKESDKFFIELSLQDQVSHSGYPYKVNIA